MRKVMLELRWPEPAGPGWIQEAFVGAWHPTAELEVSVPPEGNGISLSRRASGNWCIVGTQPAFLQGGSLVHARPLERADNGVVAMAFRGYLASPPLHSWVGDASLFAAQDNWPVSPNGIFAAASINARERSLTLQVDAFGVAPLYWRVLDNGVVLFATSPRYLRLTERQLDPCAARSMLSRGTVLGDMSLVPGVVRVPAGARIRFDSKGRRTEHWFSFDSLPSGDEPLSDSLLSDIEDAFQAAMDRCLTVAGDYELVLPLSGGDDSRRFLGALLSRKTSFRAETIRTVGKNLRDADASFATELARHYGFPHRVHGDMSLAQFATNDSRYRLLLGTELSLSSWLMPLMESLPQAPVALFDGVAGDTLGNDCNLVPLALYDVPQAQLDRELIRFLLPETSNRIFVPEQFTPLEQVQNRILDAFRRLPSTQNRIILATLLTHTRREVGAPMHHLVSAGRLVLCPYFDLDYVAEALRLAPAWKHQQSLQARCLERFHPQLYAMPNSKRNNASAPLVKRGFHRERTLAQIRQLRKEVGARRLVSLYRRTLVAPYSYAAFLSPLSHRLQLITQWWLHPLLMLESERLRAVSTWRIRQAS